MSRSPTDRASWPVGLRLPALRRKPTGMRLLSINYYGMYESLHEMCREENGNRRDLEIGEKPHKMEYDRDLEIGEI